MSTNINQSHEHWRYVNGIKFSTIVSAIENFSTREPAAKSLANLFAAIGRELGELVSSEREYHIFNNPDIKQLHYMNCKANSYQETKSPIEFRYEFDKSDKLKWLFLTFRTKTKNDNPDPIVIFNPDEKLFPKALLEVLDNPTHIAFAPFCRNDTPFGYYFFCWYTNNLPLIFKSGNTQGNLEYILREGAINVLDYVHTLVTTLISNHFPIHRDTYIPTFQKIGIRTACILFADIRNFTTAFEYSRLVETAGNQYPQLPQLLTGFVKSFLEAASIIISQSGIGRIDKFLGDGIMATFGDYLAPEESVDKVCCLLSLYSACMLQSAFEKLFILFKKHPIYTKFLLESNDVFNIALGIGIDYGSVLFDYFGSVPEQDTRTSNLIGGYLEYTAVGDHVNTAQRLEGLASKPAMQVSVLERAPLRKDEALIAPIMLSRTTFMRISQILSDTSNNPLLKEVLYRSTFSLKGKGTAIEAYEVFPDEINGDFILRVLQNCTRRQIYLKIEAAWNGKKFDFDDETIKKLAKQYFPN